MEVQIFGTQKNQDVRKALRFWKERRVRVHFVDLKERSASRGELQRFTQKFGLSALIDKQSKRFGELGLGAGRYDDERWMQWLVDEPLLLVTPLTRWQHKVTVGIAEDEWKLWIVEEKP